jgi:hypothetical protein
MDEGKMKIGELVGPGLDRLQRFALIAAVVGLVLCVVGILVNMNDSYGARRFFESYLFAFMFWFGITLGSLAFLMVHHVTGGGWGFILRRVLEASTRNLPVVLALFVPIIFGMNHLYADWIHPHGAHAAVVQKKLAYLNTPGFIIRAVLYFAIWMTMAFFLNKWSAQQDEHDDGTFSRKLNMLSAAGLLIYVLTLTFASIDWVMSLMPLWYSALFGVVILAGQALSTLALMSFLVSRLAGHTDLVKRVEPRYFRDIGNLMLAFTLFWAYTNFSQFLIYWSGNIAEEVEFYTERMHGPWLVIGTILAFFHFFFPFFSLLSSSLKVNINNLAKLGVFIILMRHLDLFWYVTPHFRQEGASNPLAAFYITDLGAPLLIGGIWLWAWAREVRSRPVVPVHDPRLQAHWPLKEVVQHG